ncbi:MAG: IS110 family transposase [Candidatus Rokubacteria bacterium]|nr:IS110 family transposase [Candidatus Rokubacteria bacterium]
MKDTRIYVGLDVHKDTIAVCWVSEDGATEETREIANEPRAVRKLFHQLAAVGAPRACYEAGPCGYEVRRQLEALGIACEVVAPSLIPRRPGDHVKTDRRDARKLARLYRAGELTVIRVPTRQEEAARDLVRCREDLGEDVTRLRHRLGKFLLRHGRIWRERSRWSARHWSWLRAQRFDDPIAQRTFEEYLAQLDHGVDRLRALDGEIVALAQQAPWAPLVARLRCLRGLDTLSALTLLVELQDFHRFRSPRELMSFVGLTPSLYASGGREVRGSITKAGNAHARRIFVEAAWHYRHRPMQAGRLRTRAAGQPEPIRAEALRAQHRLHRRFRHLVGRGKPHQVAVVAVARELVGFVWALLVKHEALEAGAA